MTVGCFSFKIHLTDNFVDQTNTKDCNSDETVSHVKLPTQ